VVGIFHCAVWERHRSSDIVLHQQMDRATMAETKIIRESDLGSVEACGRERRMEDHPPESAASALSNESIELSLWLNPDSIRTCMLWVAIGQAPGLFLYSYLGTLGQLGLNLARGKTHPRAIEYWVWLGGFASAAVILILLGRIALRVLQEAERKTREDQRTDSFGDEISQLQPTVSQQVMTFHDPNLASMRESRREVTADVRTRKKV
jgi:hypothetical protein